MKRMFIVLNLILSILTVSHVLGQEASDHAVKVRQAVEKGVAFLRSTQAPSGAWELSRPGGGGPGSERRGGPGQGGPRPEGVPQGQRTGARGGRSMAAMVGPTSVILTGLFDVGLKSDDPMMEKGMAFLKAAAKEDGGIYTQDGFFQNYETCVAIMCFVAANNVIKAEKKSETGPYDELLQKAQKFLVKNQYTEERGVESGDMYYGGVGYGGDSRPDLSNTQFLLDALIATGKKADDPEVQKAMVFVSRCQNLESEHNTQAWAAKNPDGGFVYTSKTSSAGETADGGLRSYGSMTYAGFKSMLYAGLSKDDKRVKAAFDWITKHYSVKENPGMGQTGLYYYYQTMAKALDVLKAESVKDAEGKEHAWKTELSDELLSKQREDGSWINTESAQYMENNPNLVTGFVLLVLADCSK